MCYTKQENSHRQDALTNEQAEQIGELGSVTLAGTGRNIHCLNIIGQVEGHYVLPPENKTTKYEHVIPALVAVEHDGLR